MSRLGTKEEKAAILSGWLALIGLLISPKSLGELGGMGARLLLSFSSMPDGSLKLINTYLLIKPLYSSTLHSNTILVGFLASS
ncbi:hypothetical protein LHYA1_G009233 [Lachnellula hyalina]|uniref:Uncharacterized protein n=1 Tax=Lachnellula hyalina TaxID=1316788 RepID=A0A8H8TVD0_9HELO|nr:uncharacterized protein LHYA1_G009233 [Lachnellula hyalina]TVY22120.1 hypothetical protein LHYA1_G009233 [Lachnellula hyalina]